MILNKKGVQAHILVLLIISAIMTVLLISAFGTFFANDHIKCQDFEFEIEKCVEGGNVKINVENIGSAPINFKSDYESTPHYVVEVEKTSKLSFTARSEYLKVIPYYKDKINNEEYECKGKTLKIEKNRLTKCP